MRFLFIILLLMLSCTDKKVQVIDHSDILLRHIDSVLKIQTDSLLSQNLRYVSELEVINNKYNAFVQLKEVRNEKYINTYNQSVDSLFEFWAERYR